MTEIRSFDQIGQADSDVVGGKGLSLGLMARARLPVPPGFCVTSAAYRRLRGQSLRDDASLAAGVSEAYRRLGAPVTLLKRGLLRMLAQYHAQLLADQTRFNVHVLGHIRRLENRIEELEGQLLAREEQARSTDEPRP